MTRAPSGRALHYRNENPVSVMLTGFSFHSVSKTDLGGKRGIRTPGTVARSPHFECGPIDHSGIFPSVAVQDPRVVRPFMILTVCKDNNFRAKKYSSSEKINIYPLFLCRFPPVQGFAGARKPSAAAVRRAARRPATSAFGGQVRSGKWSFFRIQPKNGLNIERKSA